MKKSLLITIVLITLGYFSVKAQGSDDKWAIGLSSSSVLFDKDDASKIGQRYNVQFPRINVSRELSYGLSFDVALTFNVLENVKGLIANNFNYTSLDLAIRYDFGRSERNLVPYIGFGIGYIDGASTVPGSATTFSANALGGATFWISERFGLTGQLTYKYVSADIISMVSHVQGSAGIVFRLGASSSQKRLWER